MTSYCVSRNPVHNFLAVVILVAAVVLIFAGSNSVVEANESAPFIVMASKSIPTMGRRSGTFDDFFRKASKSVPRMGRRGYPPQGPIKAAESWPWYPKRPTDLSKAEGDEAWFAENFAHVMEKSPELWEKIAAEMAGDSPTATGFTNEDWQREKRTGSEPATV